MPHIFIDEAGIAAARELERRLNETFRRDDGRRTARALTGGGDCVYVYVYLWETVEPTPPVPELRITVSWTGRPWKGGDAELGVLERFAERMILAARGDYVDARPRDENTL